MAEVSVVRLLEPQWPVYGPRLAAVIRDGVLQPEISDDVFLRHLERLPLCLAFVVEALEAHRLAYLQDFVAQTVFEVTSIRNR